MLSTAVGLSRQVQRLLTATDLDMADVEYSYKQPTLFTITVQGRLLNSSPASSPPQDISQWHLPAPDLHNDGRYIFRLHTVDMYFWTADDAGLFLDSLKRVLAPGQLRVLHAPAGHPEHRDSMSPVVQQLEQAAIIAAPQPQSAQLQPQNQQPQQPQPQQQQPQQYQQYQQQPQQYQQQPQQYQQQQRSASISTTQTAGSATAATAPAHIAPAVSPPSVSTASPPPASAPTPLAYNPAAPAAPEPIAHREKTPPPIDGESGTGLKGVAGGGHANPQAGAYGGGYGANPLQQQFAPQVGGGPYVPGGMPGIQRANTLAAVPQQMPVQQMPVAQQIALQQQQMQPQQQQRQQAVPAAAAPATGYAPSFAPPPVDPNAHLYAMSQQPPQALQQQQAEPHPGLARHATMPAGYAAGQPPPQQQQQPGYGPQDASGAADPPTPGAPPPSYASSTPGYAAALALQQQQQHQLHLQEQQRAAQQLAQQQMLTQAHGVSHSMHKQLYIPEGASEPAQAGPGQEAAMGRFEQRMNKTDKAVGSKISRLLRKADKY
jgi:hypothetical protein